MEPRTTWLSLWLPALPPPSSWERQDEVGFFRKHAPLLTLLPWGRPLCLSLNSSAHFSACVSQATPPSPADLDVSGSKMTWAKHAPSSGLPNQRACFPFSGGKNECYTAQSESTMPRLGEPAPNVRRVGLNSEAWHCLMTLTAHVLCFQRQGQQCPLILASARVVQVPQHAQEGSQCPVTHASLHLLLESSTAWPSQKAQDACKYL